MLTARMVIRTRVTSIPLAAFRERLILIFMWASSMLFANNNFGGLHVLTHSRSSIDGALRLPGQTDHFDVLRPVVSCEWILIPGAWNGVSLKHIKLDQSTTGN